MPAPAPFVVPPRVVVRDNKIEISEKIQFDFDKDTIKPVSFDLMNEIAAVIAKSPRLKKIRIEGYASSEGDAKHNRVLSDDRAKSVMKYLTDHGIETPRLVAIGFGVEKPVGDNTTEDGRELNRRVDFVIVDQDVTTAKVQIDSKTGAEKVLNESHDDVTSPTDLGDGDSTHRVAGAKRTP